MPLPKTLARFNKYATNRIARPVAGWAPLMGVVHHTGRKSHQAYQTPVNVFVDGDRYVISLTYGPDTDWVKNVTAAGGCRLTYRGSTVYLTDPQLVHREDDPKAIPVPVSLILDAIKASELLILRRA